MKALTLLAVGLIVGFGVGWLLSPGAFRHYYQTTKEITLLADDGTRLGRVPSGSVLVSDERLFPTADLGWWGYVPIQFDTRDVALELGIVEGRRPSSIADFTLRAEFDYSSGADEVRVEPATPEGDTTTATND
jgi:hypothetical protein